MMPPRVFLSYSWDSSEHREWVERLALRLTEDGLDVRLDIWDHTRGWATDAMTEGIRAADCALVICTPAYRTKAESSADDRDSGVRWEARLLQAAMRDALRERVVPVLRRGEWRAAAPLFLRDLPYVDLRPTRLDERVYAQLLRRLHGVPNRRPLIGRPPPLVEEPLAPLRADVPRVSPTHNLPYHAQHAFVGRAGLVSTLHEALAPAGPPPEGPVVVQGLAGGGKTWLALHYAYTHLDAFDVVCWVDVGALGAVDGLASLAGTLGLEATGTPRQRADQVRRALEDGRRGLLILDNVDSDTPVDEIQPRTGLTRRLLLTRRRDVWGVRVIRIGLLSQEEGVALLGQGRPIRPAELPAARQLVEELEFLPLPIHVASRTLAVGHVTFEELLQSLRVDGAGTLFEDTLDVSPLARLFASSARHLNPSTSLGGAAWAVLAVCGALGPAPIPFDLLRAGVEALGDPERSTNLFLKAIQALQTVGLIDVDPEIQAVRVHALVQAWARQVRSEDAQRAVLDAISGDGEVNVQPTGPEGGIRLADPLRGLKAHLGAAVRGLHRGSSKAHLAVGWALVSLRALSFEASSAAALVSQLEELDDVGAHVVLALNFLLFPLAQQRRWEAARAHVARRRSKLGPASADLLLEALDIASGNGAADAAEALVARAGGADVAGLVALVLFWGTNRGAGNPGLVRAIEGMADIQEGAAWLLEGYDLQRTDGNLRTTPPALEALIATGAALGLELGVAFRRAEQGLAWELDLDRVGAALAAAPRDAVEAASSRYHYGCLLAGVGRLEEALEELRTAVAAFEAVRPPDDMDLALSRLATAGVLARLDRPLKALALARLAAATFVRAFPDSHVTANALMVLHALQGVGVDDQVAIADLTHAEAILEAILAGGSAPRGTPDLLAATRLELARRLDALGRRKEAGRVCRGVDAARLRWRDAWGLARLATRCGQPDCALAAFLAAEEEMGDAGCTDPWTVWNAVGISLFAQRRYGEAEARFRRALDAAAASDLPSPIESSICFNLGNALQAQGRYQEAVPWLEQAIALRAADPAPLQRTRKLLSEVLERLGRYAGAESWARAVWEAEADPVLGAMALERWLDLLEMAGAEGSAEDWAAAAAAHPRGSSRQLRSLLGVVEAHLAEGEHHRAVAALRRFQGELLCPSGLEEAKAQEALVARWSALAAAAGLEADSRPPDPHAEGLAHFKAGRYSAARASFEAALEARIGGDRTLALAATLHSLGHTYEKLGLAGRAIPMVEGAITIRQQLGDTTAAERSVQLLIAIRGRVGRPSRPSAPPTRRGRRR